MLILQDLLLVISGALGTLLLRTGAKITFKIHADTRPLAEYYCSDENATPGPGRLSRSAAIEAAKQGIVVTVAAGNTRGKIACPAKTGLLKKHRGIIASSIS